MKVLLDYVFPVTVIEPTPAASTAHLKQVCLVVNPKSMVDAGEVTLCVNMAEVSALTDNTNAQQFFNAGMNRVYILTADDLDIDSVLEANSDKFFTVVISDDFDHDDVEPSQATGTVTITDFANLVDSGDDTVTVGDVVFVASSSAVTPGDATFQASSSNDATASSLAAQINAHEDLDGVVTASVVGAIVTITSVATGSGSNLIALEYSDEGTATVGATVSGSGFLTGGDGLFAGSFRGVIGVSSDDQSFLEAQAGLSNRCAFYALPANGAKNMCFAFGSLLSNLGNWLNQQYVSMPFNDEVTDLGQANLFFDERISFVLNDLEFGNRLAFFAAGGRAIVAPYIIENLKVDLQSRTLQYISANQPQYTIREASLLENRLQEDVINLYIERLWLDGGQILIKLFEQNFVANGFIDIPQPKALWRVFSELRQSV